MQMGAPFATVNYDICESNIPSVIATHDNRTLSDMFQFLVFQQKRLEELMPLS